MELRLQRGHYYAYRVTSKYDPTIKRSRKVTLEFLGAITPKGLVPPKHKRPPRLGGRLDAGNIVFLDSFVRPLQDAVEASFPDDWQSLIAAAVLKLCYLGPCSRLLLRYETSLAKRRWPEATLDDDRFPEVLRRVGLQWASQREVFRALARDEKHMAIDLSHVFSESQQIPWLEYGYNADGVWRPQLQILLCWCTTTHRPGFLQILTGATQSAEALATAIKEAPVQDVIAIMDKGFWSPENVKAFEDAGVHYVMALRRDLPIVHLVSHARYTNHFLYRDSAEWWHKDDWDGRTIYHYLDKKVMADEENGYLRRIAQAQDRKQKKRLEKSYREDLNALGTLSVLTDAGLSAADAYALVKERREVEYAYDALQNELRGDVTWMRSKEGMVAYHFILFLSLHLYSQVLDHLKRRKMLLTYSVRDVLTYLSKVDVVEVNGKEYLLPVTKQTQRVIDRLEVPITEKLGLQGGQSIIK
ncbi:MAG: transposase [Candidatus Thermoplasmatota archaeon]